jgi:sugar phosphate isomerase/epimerase
MDTRMGLCIDIGHTARTGADIVESIRLAGPRLHEMHFKDLKDKTAKESQVAVGEGVLPIREIFEQLIKQKYTGYCSLEYEIHETDPLPGMQTSFAYMRKVLAEMHS